MSQHSRQPADALHAGGSQHSSTPRWLTIFCLLAGFGDAVTGLLLVVAPAFTLTLMGITLSPSVSSSELIYVSFVGVFVGSVGLSYLYPLLGDPTHRLRRWREVLEVTALLRFSVGLFVTWSLVAGDLPWGWVSVPLTDFTLATVQLLILRKLAPL
jgi:hypothetical protein